ncbi:hypothetical protein TREMEDRAFT_11630, partial [Tremella mesenterica DSM 1558]|uniref:uncharacterized protein n=1 Tax=Tremella mesenterica (strain ATCC 24925 / CBS 8224 / DSM 1558 / NBRC 9311 / NRRL Y-6157 / RJB 2259-6 / UBC 559-6) TaxID=578456 RepID=UPI0003F4905F
KSRKKEEEKDDLTSRLIRGLGKRPFTECPIVPPPLRISDDPPEWRCPGCRKSRIVAPGAYICFCGRLTNPPTSNIAPHSCEDLCSRRRGGCDHPCPLTCHPGPCPPCQTALIVPCPSHHTPLAVKCAVVSGNTEIGKMGAVCDEICGRSLGCGNPAHVCQAPCHHGACNPCAQTQVVMCYCGQESRVVACGSMRQEEKRCASIGEDGVEEHWNGRFSCGKECDRFYDCGIHPCKEKCHPHPSIPLPCPTSPNLIHTCPCGLTPLSSLPAPPRTSCINPIPTCDKSCPRSRPCGHACPQKCHVGECPPCHSEVVRPCRCGESVVVLECDELRKLLDSGGEVMCERVCGALRNCGRHECGRVCCPLSYQGKNRKKRGIMTPMIDREDDLHVCELTCGRLLSCGLHTCAKKDHRGACGRCLESSFDELICNCGRTIIQPPVPCGTILTCPFPCSRPSPSCGHPKSPHPCHQTPDCPPCPYLTTRPCACGKDLHVKNVRCSQDRVSCGQRCNLLLECGYHRCLLSCHKTGECQPCNQICSKPKRICKHPCMLTCHAPIKCQENSPCHTIVVQTCSCGHLQNRTNCGASTNNPITREGIGIKCNSECLVRQRNVRLADALGIKVDKEKTFDWSLELKSFASNNIGFVKMVEDTFAEFIKGTRSNMILPHMPPAKRTFVISLADQYRLSRELIDAEPNRSVQIRRKIDTRIPPVLLSQVSQTPTIASKLRSVLPNSKPNTS